MSNWTAENHKAARARCVRATEGPWAPWLDQDGADHMNGMLMVGNADAVIPDGDTWVDDVDVNPVAHVYTPEDREFIAHARSDIPALLDEIERLRALTTITDDMVGRSHAAVFDHLSANAGCVYAEDDGPDMLRTALEAALNPGDGA